MEIVENSEQTGHRSSKELEKEIRENSKMSMCVCVRMFITHIFINCGIV